VTYYWASLWPAPYIAAIVISGRPDPAAAPDAGGAITQVQQIESIVILQLAILQARSRRCCRCSQDGIAGAVSMVLQAQSQ
jgi:hypothetical protein